MSTDATTGLGSEFRRWDPNSQSSQGDWEKIAEVNSITPPDKSRDTIDVTDLSSGNYKEFIGSIRDAGSVSISMNFTREEYEKLDTDFNQDTPKNYEILIADDQNTSIEIEALVTELPIGDLTVEDKITCDVSFKVTGAPTMNSGSGSGS